MGNFYTNYTLRGISQQDVVDHMRGRSAVISPVYDGCVVVLDEQSEEQDMQIINDLASKLSGALSCPLLAIINHDDDVLFYFLYVHGELADEYNSCPAYFDDSADASEPTGGSAEKLCEAFGATEVENVEKVLPVSSLDSNGYPFAVMRHQALCKALGLPGFGVGAGYHYFEATDLPGGPDRDEWLRTS